MASSRRLLLLFLSFALLACGGEDSSSGDATRDFFFYVSADPQINVAEWGLAGLDSMVRTMNRSPGSEWPFGGTVDGPRGVIVPGDLVDDVSNRQNWAVYRKYFDPKGEGKLRFPVYAGIGNHDLSDSTDQRFSYVERGHIRRNQERPARLHLGPEGYHYSWEWSGVHFVCLNVFPGVKPRPVYGNPAPWNDPKNALDFLRRELEEHVGTSTRPVVLFWHYGLRGWGLEKWWTEEDLSNLRSALSGYNVVLILHGHEHRFERYEWAGYDVVMAPAPYSPGEEEGSRSIPKGFLVVQITDDSLRLGHHGADTWEEAWAKPLEAKTTVQDEAIIASPASRP